MRYPSLPIVTTSKPAALCARQPRDYVALSEASPALEVVVDFCRESAITIDPQQRIDVALRDMVRAGVRTLLVVADGRVEGLITAYDIQGEKPIRFMQSSDCIHHPKCRHEDVQVADIMTPLAKLPMLSMADIATASVGSVRETFRHTGHTHLLVTETHADGPLRIRGLVSRVQVERQLDVSSNAADMHLIEHEIARPFAS